MTKQLEAGDVLIVNNGANRMTYLGDGFARIETFIPERSKTGGLTHSGNGKWIVDPMYPGRDSVKLTDKQVAFWLSKK